MLISNFKYIYAIYWFGPGNLNTVIKRNVKKISWEEEVCGDCMQNEDNGNESIVLEDVVMDLLGKD